jgi:uncharacterized protein (DUF983 family)
MIKREYACPNCRKTVHFLPLIRRRSCPHCGREVMDWDALQSSGDGETKRTFSWVFVAIVILGIALIVASFLFFRAGARA